MYIEKHLTSKSYFRLRKNIVIIVLFGPEKGFRNIQIIITSLHTDKMIHEEASLPTTIINLPLAPSVEKFGDVAIY